MKKTIITTLCVAGALSVCGQEQATVTLTSENGTVTETVEQQDYGKYRVITNTFWNNWFIQAGAGAQISFTEHDKQCKIGDRISPALNVSVGKWFTPNVGARLTYSGLSVKGATQGWGQPDLYSHSTGKPVPGKYTHDYGFLEKQKFNYMNIHADLMVNLTQLIMGYNPERTYNLIPYIGVGYAHVMSSPQSDEITGNIGISNAFRLSAAWDLNFDVNCMLANERFSVEDGNRALDALLNATLGVTYKFKKRGFDIPYNVTRTVIDHNNKEVNGLREQLAKESAEIADLKAALAEASNKATVTNLIASGNIVFFDIDKWNVTDKTRASLSFLAKSIKESTVPYTVTGYADKGTGTAPWNETLSKNRAEAIYNVLINEFGVPADKLIMEYRGGVDDMFYNDPRCSRCVIVIPKK